VPMRLRAAQWKHRCSRWRRGICSPGVVYLMRCRLTGEYKYGSSTNPYDRLCVLTSYARCRLGRELEYVWSIVTNAPFRLESFLHERWRQFRADDKRREWVNLPDDEVATFRGVCSVMYKGVKTPKGWIECVRGPFVPPRKRGAKA
jgi:hypothetical protein